MIIFNRSQAKAKLMIQQGVSPVIIDNTNTMCWEAKAYVEPAVANGYEVEILTPSTEWAFDVPELARRNRHNVPEAAIKKMFQRWEDDFTVEKILQSKPPRKMRNPSPTKRVAQKNDEVNTDLAEKMSALNTNN